MEFKAGDRVHVTRFGHKEVDFYATLTDFYFDSYAKTAQLVNCSNASFEGGDVYLPSDEYFGPDKADYYTLATYEEDSEEPVIQRVEDIEQAIEQQRVYIEKLKHDPVNKPSHYMLGDIEVKDIIAIVADKYHKGSVAHNVASALEYQMRAPEKNGLEDIKKARKCLDFAIENWE
ncbi:DUF3310 domain-containing protein [Mammaliicoccus sciuri]|uniref:DUF3310 domain-containing protein n=1 Tax=Mammaliicoccus sciuri TaxID=1296 RepID=UPI0010716BE3|nr:DUF3310 domain-containing protein [Mammaliicoccus sciuri]MBF0773259.1 DUF3310 domain-containing protein [Mammaliicoccus sciuri]TFU88280.1 DUF3310 domain-containing protein [Mammaliicoccus sciuri]